MRLPRFQPFITSLTRGNTLPSVLVSSGCPSRLRLSPSSHTRPRSLSSGPGSTRSSRGTSSRYCCPSSASSLDPFCIASLLRHVLTLTLVFHLQYPRRNGILVLPALCHDRARQSSGQMGEHCPLLPLLVYAHSFVFRRSQTLHAETSK